MAFAGFWELEAVSAVSAALELPGFEASSVFVLGFKLADCAAGPFNFQALGQLSFRLPLGSAS